MDWDKLRIFHAVALAGSFTKAEDILHVSYSALSRHVGQLENELKTPLFRRHARGLQLTTTGQILMDSVDSMVETLQTTQNRIKASLNSPMGYLKMSVPMGLGADWLLPRINSFTEQHPDMVIQLLFQDKLTDVSMGEADLALRLCPPNENSDAIWLPFMMIGFGLYARSDYLAKAGRPKVLADLEHHRLITLNSLQVTPLNYFNRFFKDTYMPAMTLNNPYGICKAVQSGLGIGVVPTALLASPDEMRANNLEAVLADEAYMVQGYFVYPTELRGTHKIKILRDFLSEEARKFEALWAGAH